MVSSSAPLGSADGQDAAPQLLRQRLHELVERRFTDVTDGSAIAVRDLARELGDPIGDGVHARRARDDRGRPVPKRAQAFVERRLVCHDRDGNDRTMRGRVQMGEHARAAVARGVAHEQHQIRCPEATTASTTP